MRYLILSCVLIGVAIVGIAGFRGSMSRKPPIMVFPDMDNQLKVRPQEPSAFFADGLGSRRPVPGTVARAESMMVGGESVFPYEAVSVNTGRMLGTTNFVELNPMKIDGALLKRGRERFNISCSPCHGKQGNGKGIVSEFNWPTIANLHDQRIVGQPDGELFETISYGKNTMSGYAANVTVPDRWAIVAYLRALQLSRLGTLADVPEDQRSQLK